MQTLYLDTQYMMSKSLGALAQLLRKVEEQLKSRGDDEKILLDTRLAPDMFPFVRQVQMVSDNAKGAMARLSGREIPSMEDTEASLAELVERLEKTKAYVDATTAEDLAGADQQKIVIKYMPGQFQSGEDYTRDYAIPNFYFHMATAYAILRLKGYDIGKADFIGGLHLQDL